MDLLTQKIAFNCYYVNCVTFRSFSQNERNFSNFTWPSRWPFENDAPNLEVNFNKISCIQELYTPQEQITTLYAQKDQQQLYYL